jgi:hypothetical protein
MAINLQQLTCITAGLTLPFSPDTRVLSLAKPAPRPESRKACAVASGVMATRQALPGLVAVRPASAFSADAISLPAPQGRAKA